jgi:hypothetical protein
MEIQTIPLGNRRLLEVGDSNLINALKTVQKECRSVLYMPKLIDARIAAEKGSKLLYATYLTPSIQVTGKTKQGTPVVAYVHTKNYFSNSENIINSHQTNGARVMPRESFFSVLDNEGDDIIVIDYNALRNSSSGIIEVRNAIKHPLLIPFCGSEERAKKYLEKHLEIYGPQMSIWHCDDLVDEPLARPLAIGVGSMYSSKNYRYGPDYCHGRYVGDCGLEDKLEK